MEQSAQPAGSHVIDVMTVAEVASMLRVSKMTVYRLLEIGEIRSFRIGRSLRLQQADVVDYLRRSQFSTPAEPQHHGAQDTDPVSQHSKAADVPGQPADGPVAQARRQTGAKNGQGLAQRPGGHDRSRPGKDEQLVDALASAGRFDQARTVLLAEEHPYRQARMLLNLARAALASQRWDIAESLLESMNHTVSEPPAKLVVERLELVARLRSGSALNVRIAIDQAAGVLAQRLGVGMDEAAELFRGHARDHGYSLAALARTVIAGTDDITSAIPTLLPGQADPARAHPDRRQGNRP
ncbi:MAG TPA: excisionase family DNA-binding protein [Pseudonocardia sp.]|uniref:excisionase family DNA-binding protein n=1 Tax=Pseudonocardia sp. TaxID=60912 RepID=UPI002F416048